MVSSWNTCKANAWNKYLVRNHQDRRERAQGGYGQPPLLRPSVCTPTPAPAKGQSVLAVTLQGEDHVVSTNSLKLLSLGLLQRAIENILGGFASNPAAIFGRQYVEPAS